MRIWCHSLVGTGTREEFRFSGNRVRIGRAADNDLVLNNPFVPPEAAVLVRDRGNDQHWELVALGLAGIEIEGGLLPSGERAVIEPGQAIKIFPYSLSIELQEDASEAGDDRSQLDWQMAEFTKTVHAELLDKMDLGAPADQRYEHDEYQRALERNIEEIAKEQGLSKDTPLCNYLAGHSVRDALLSKVVGETPQSGQLLTVQRDWPRLRTTLPDLEEERDETAAFVARALQLDQCSDLPGRITILERDFWDEWNALDDRLHPTFINYVALRYLKKEIKDIVFGYGPLEDLLRLPTISEIMVVDSAHIYVERNGSVENSGRRFVSDKATETIIDRIVSKVGRRIDKAQPLVDARLADGSRVNAVIPPLALNGPCLTIRKFPERKLLMENLLAMGSLTQSAAEFLRAAVLSRCNVLISGGTGTGKTTLLNCLSDFIPNKERIVTIEDTAELQLKKEHVVRLETKPPNVEGKGAYTIRDLVKNALRMRPDRIVVGECRGPEALDMLQAMNTGHDGSLTTIHANSARDVILRLEVLVQMAADLPVDSIHRQVVSAIDLVVQLTRLRDGRRCVSQISELTEAESGSGKIIQLRDLFLLNDLGEHPQLVPTGRLPTFMGRLVEKEMISLEHFYL